MSFSVRAPQRDLCEASTRPYPWLMIRTAIFIRKTLGGRICRRGSAAAVSFLFLFWFASYSNAEILIEPRIGFHGVFQLGHPFPLEIGLSNSGRPAEGTLEIVVWKGGATKGGVAYPLYYRREIFLPAQSQKSVQLTVDPDFISRPLKITFSSPTDRASREVDLRRHFSPAPVTLIVSEGNAIPPVSLGSFSRSRLVALALAELPADPRALLGVSHLIFYDQSLRDLSRSQLLALDVWLTAGGRMVILGSLNYALYQESAISRFLPVRVTGTERISFHPNLGPKEVAASIDNVWSQTATLLTGNVLAETGGIPILVEASRGKGSIAYLSVDIGRPPLSQWDGLPKLLQPLLASPVAENFGLRSRWDETVFTQLILSPSFISTYVPTGTFFIAIVGYLIFLGTFLWLWQRRRFARRMMVVTLVGVVVLSTVGGYLVFSRGDKVPDGILLTSTVMESSADGYVEAQSNLAMFSTQIRHYDLTLERGWIELVPVSHLTKERAEPAVVFQDGGGFSRFQLPLREWDYRLFRVRFVDRFPVRAEFEQQGAKLVMRLYNQSAKDLVDCWLVAPGQRYALGDIPKGARWTREFALVGAEGQQQAGRRSDTIDFREIPFKEKTREILFRASFFPRDDAAAHWNTGAAVFFGWVKDPEPRVSVHDSRIRNYDYSLFRKIVPLAGPEDE